MTPKQLREDFSDGVAGFPGKDTEENFRAWLSLCEIFDIDPYQDGYEEADAKILASVSMRCHDLGWGVLN